MASFVLLCAAVFCTTVISQASSAVTTTTTSRSWIHGKPFTVRRWEQTTPSLRRSTSTADPSSWATYRGRTTTGAYDPWRELLRTRHTRPTPTSTTTTLWPWLTKRTTTKWWQMYSSSTGRSTTTPEYPWWPRRTTTDWHFWVEHWKTERPTTPDWEFAEDRGTTFRKSRHWKKSRVTSFAFIVVAIIGGAVLFIIISASIGYTITVLRRKHRAMGGVCTVNVQTDLGDYEQTVNPVGPLLLAPVQPNAVVSPPSYCSLYGTAQTPPPYVQVCQPHQVTPTSGESGGYDGQVFCV